MEAEAKGANPSSTRITRSAATKKKRKPLSDLTNLIPSSTIHKPSISIAKPYNSNSKPVRNSSKSDSSIGSSNDNNKHAPNPSTVPSTPHSSSAVPVYSRKSIAEETVSKGKDVDVPFSCSIQEKAKDIGNALKADLVALNFSPVKKIKDKGKAVAVPSTYSHVEKAKDKGEAIAGHFSYRSVEKTHDKGKVTAVSSNSVSLERVRDKGKNGNVTPNASSLAKTKDKGKAVAVPANFSTLEKTKERTKGVSVAFSCPPLPRTRHIGIELNEAGDIGLSESHTDPHLKHKQKRCCTPEYKLPQDFIKQQRAYFKEVDEFELSEEEISDNEVD